MTLCRALALQGQVLPRKFHRKDQLADLSGIVLHAQTRLVTYGKSAYLHSPNRSVCQLFEGINTFRECKQNLG